ncbi:glycoside hydrolase family 36 protein [Lasius niger]|uniref:Glycoside hydrolase family 36 protein n=1 Tax=Lasius niger TaxID=67767 RepID=A0A0J7JU63_LASNI|nr:glycoside hydrolase family 36 protein [Lasius niger]
MVTSSIRQGENGRVSVDTRLKALGVLVEGDMMATIRDQPVPRHTARVSQDDDCVFEVDVQTAWKEMGLDSVEVDVKVYFGA